MQRQTITAPAAATAAAAAAMATVGKVTQIVEASCYVAKRVRINFTF